MVLPARDDLVVTLRRLCGSAICYFLAAVISIGISRLPGNIATIWFANAVAIAVLTHNPRRFWGQLIAAFGLANVAANLVFSYDLALAASFLPANLIECLAGALLINRFMPMARDEISPTIGLRLIILGTVLPALGSATLGALTIQWHGFAPFERVWPVWFIGTVVGGTAMLPVAMAACRVTTRFAMQTLLGLQMLYGLALVVGVSLLASTFLPFPLSFISLTLMLAALYFSVIETLVFCLASTMVIAWMKSSGLFVMPPATSDWQVLLTYLPIAATIIGPILIAAGKARDEHLWAQLNEATLAARRGDVAKSQFMAAMSHELRTPMNGIMGAAQLGLMSAKSDEEKESFTIVLDESRHLLHLINEVLDISRLETNQLEIHEAPFSLHESFEQILNEYMELASRHGIQFQSRFDVSLPLSAIGDAQRIAQIVKSLLDNAVKFTEQGKISVQIFLDERGMLCIEVADTGIGIAPDKLAAVFRPFEQIDGSLTRARGGAGLGLALARRVAIAMGGTLDVESRLGEGSCFLLKVPLKYT